MRLVTSLLAVLFVVSASHAEVLCVRAKKNGTLSGPIKVRTACKKREVRVDGTMLGLCCDGTTTTTVSGPTTSLPGASTTVTSATTLTTAVTVVTTTSLTCPTITTTTLGINVCGGTPPTCNGLCANARGCVNDGIACSCTGPTLPCGVVTSGGTCGGACPGGMTCMQTTVLGNDGCPEYVTCACGTP